MLRILLIGLTTTILLVAGWLLFALSPTHHFEPQSVQPLKVLRGHTRVDEFGHSVSLLGDLDGDGVGDLLIGAPNEDHGYPNAGAGRIYSGRNLSELFVLSGDGEGWHHGSGVAGAGDVDGDGVEDIVIGMKPNGKTGLGPGGGARVFSGRSRDLLFTFGGRLQRRQIRPCRRRCR